MIVGQNVNSNNWCSLFIGYTENTAFQFASDVPLPWHCYWKLNIICLRDLGQEVFLKGETASVQGIAGSLRGKGTRNNKRWKRIFSIFNCT